MKYFRMSYDEVVFRRSYLNLLLLNRAIPGMKPLKDEDDMEDTNDISSKIVRHEIKEDNAADFFMNFM